MAEDGNARLQLSDQFWERYRKRFAWDTGNKDLADDLVQEARIRVFRWIDKNGQPAYLRSLVRTVYGSVLNDWLRAKERSREVRSDDSYSDRSDPAARHIDADGSCGVRALRA